MSQEYPMQMQKKLFHLIHIQGLKKKTSLHQEMKDICHLGELEGECFSS